MSRRSFVQKQLDKNRKKKKPTVVKLMFPECIGLFPECKCYTEKMANETRIECHTCPYNK